MCTYVRICFIDCGLSMRAHQQYHVHTGQHEPIWFACDRMCTQERTYAHASAYVYLISMWARAHTRNITCAHICPSARWTLLRTRVCTRVCAKREGRGARVQMRLHHLSDLPVGTCAHGTARTRTRPRDLDVGTCPPTTSRAHARSRVIM